MLYFIKLKESGQGEVSKSHAQYKVTLPAAAAATFTFRIPPLGMLLTRRKEEDP